jgi:hypothetical protein
MTIRSSDGPRTSTIETAAYFAQVGLKKDEASGNATIGGTAVEGAKPLWEEVYDTGIGDMKHQRTQQVVAPKLTVRLPIRHSRGSIAPRSIRFLGHQLRATPTLPRASSIECGDLLGKGLIEPIDDIRAGNPPSIPELLEFLEKDFKDHAFDVRHLIPQLICTSDVYQLSIEPNQWNADDDRQLLACLPNGCPPRFFSMRFTKSRRHPNCRGFHPEREPAALADADAGLPDGFLNNLGRPPRRVLANANDPMIFDSDRSWLSSAAQPSEVDRRSRKCYSAKSSRALR